MHERFVLTAVTPSGTIEQWDEVTESEYAAIIDILGLPKRLSWPELPIDTLD